MALTFTGAGTAVAASGAGQAVTTTTAFAVGDYLVALIAYDNSGGGGSDPMSGTITITPATGALDTAVSAQTGHNDPGAASAGLAARCVVRPVTTAIPSGTVVTLGWSGTVVVRAAVLGKLTAGGIIGYRTNSGATGVITGNVNVANAAALVTPSVNAGEGVLCWACEENGVAIGGDADTTNGSWATIYGANTGTGVAGMSAAMQFKQVTATATQTFNPTGNATLSDWITGAIIFTEAPRIAQAEYGIYASGTESGSTVTSPVVTLADSYPQTNYSGSVGTGGTSIQSAGQSFLGDGFTLAKARFWLAKVGNPTGTLTARLYAHTGTYGTGTGKGTGTALATSTTSISATTVTASPFSWYAFDFDGSYTLVAGTPYVIVVEITAGGGDASNYVQVGNDATSPTHSGTIQSFSLSWTTSTSADVIFEVHTNRYIGDVIFGNAALGLRIRLQETANVLVPSTDNWQLQWEKNASGTWTNVGTGDVIGYNDPSLTEGAATTNRLGSGTGSFVAGKVSEDGVADSVGWTGNNYTELLYSVELVSANLVDADTIQFRVLRNGATTGLTYTKTPKVKVTKPLAAITQAAYRFYDQGTESGSTALQPQDTAHTGDLASGDGLGHVRIRLQETNGGLVPSTDDWQLQWEKNASGAWTNVGSPGSSVIADSYPETNASGVTGTSPGGLVNGQSFLGNGSTLQKVRFWGYKQGTGGADSHVATLYAHTGTFGSTGIGTGSALATSTAVAGSALAGTSGAQAWTEFTFDGTFTLAAGTPYVIAVGRTGATDISNYYFNSYDNISQTHAGSGSYRNSGGSWFTVDLDLIFELYTAANPIIGYNDPSLTDAAATTNRLTGGSGSFVAGKVSEDGLVDNVGWTPSNYTELLYSVQFVKAQLADNDIIRFRVLRNGATTGMTYSQTPTVTLDIPPLAVTQAAYRFYADTSESGILADTYPSSNHTGALNLVTSRPDPKNAGGQSFLGNGQNLTRIRFYMQKIGTPPGDLIARLYAHTGTFGSTGTPTGSPLATSASVTATSLGTSFSWVDFDFDGSVVLTSSTPYFITVNPTVTGDISNTTQLGLDSSSPTHPGNETDGAAIPSEDLIFELYTGTGALAAQNTAYTADISGGDVNLGLRVRLQHTGGSVAESTDDWQLQWEKNASGMWWDVTSSDVLVDSNQSLDSTQFAMQGGWIGIGQTMMGLGVPISKIQFNLATIGTAPGNATAQIFTHAGTFGSSGSPAGPALATSTSVACTSLTGVTGTPAWNEFTFSTPYVMANGTPYCVALVLSQTGTDVNNCVLFTVAPDGSHAGNRVVNTGVSWSATTGDRPFKALTPASTALPYDSANLTDGAATTNRLGAGSGSFVAGKISEDGLVNDLSWTVNNYTEVLYSLTLKASDLIATDTLKFRVLYKGATTGMTYTVSPTVNVIGDSGPSFPTYTFFFAS